MTFDEIYEQFDDRLRRFATGLTRDPDRADDLVQETVIRAMMHIHLLERLNEHKLRAWLYNTLKNLFIDEQRSRRRQAALLERIAGETDFAVLPWADVASADLFDRLPERDRELLRQRYLLGMTSREIGCELGIPAATVRSRLHLAIKRLRARKSEFL